MNSRKLGLCGAVLFSVALLAPSLGQAQHAAINLRAGTLGVAGGVTTSVLPRRINLRAEVPFFDYKHEGTQQIEDFNLAYDANAKLLSFGGLLDWHPFGGVFRLSGGAYYTKNELLFSGRSAGNVTVGPQTYTPEEIGEISGSIKMGNEIAPYVGLGFGNAVALNKRIGFTLDLGAVYMGSPKVTMEGTGMIEPTAEEAPKIEANLSWAKWYPGVSLGMSVRLF